MPDLLPKLKKISVDPRSLYLDPNNPRFITKESDRVKEDKFLDSYVIKNTTRKMYDEKKDVYNIKQIVDSIKACLLYTSPSPRDRTRSRMPSSA